MKIKQVSENLESFIKTNFKNNISTTPNISPVSHDFLKIIYNEIHNADLALGPIFNAQPVGYQYTNNSSLMNLIPTPIYNAIIESCVIKKSFLFHTAKRSITVHFSFPCSNNKISDTYLRNCMKRMFMWLFIAEKFANSICSKSMDVFIYMTDFEKLLPTNRSAIGWINANTALTTPCNGSTEIHIFRQEEWFKVFIHETFHNLGLDFSNMVENISTAEIYSIFPIKSDIRLYETYCETWAEIINLQFVTYFGTKFKNDYSKMIVKLDQLLKIEAQFSLFQSAKVLYYYGMKYNDLYDVNPKSNEKRKQYREDTNILCYYVIKSILMYHKNDFIEWTVNSNRNSLEFRKTKSNVQHYCNLVKNLYKNSYYLENMKVMEYWFHKNTNYNSFEFKNLRMTVYELCEK
jgi:hypothetical protein